jgi:hypothetical protein
MHELQQMMNVELIGTTEDELSWQERALCAQTDPEAFFPEKGGSTRDAKKVCVGCEVPGVRPGARRAVWHLGWTVRARTAQVQERCRLALCHGFEEGQESAESPTYR